MTNIKTATREEWLAARRSLLELEKAHTKLKDVISESRRALPWVKLDQSYAFESEQGSVSLIDLFGTKSQLIVYHFMFGPEWEEGCVSCSFWADSFNGLEPHLNARDIAFVAVSSAPISMIKAFKKRLGWNFNWVSSNSTSFNNDFNVGFGPDRPSDIPLMYNFEEIDSAHMDEMHGTSVLVRGDDDTVYHTYSTYGRGLDITNSAYSYIDMVPKGRNEPAEGNPMVWVRHHDNY